MFTAKLDGDVAPRLFFATWYVRLLIILNVVDWLFNLNEHNVMTLNSVLAGAVQTNDT